MVDRWIGGSAGLCASAVGRRPVRSRVDRVSDSSYCSVYLCITSSNFCFGSENQGIQGRRCVTCDEDVGDGSTLTRSSKRFDQTTTHSTYTFEHVVVEQERLKRVARSRRRKLIKLHATEVETALYSGNRMSIQDRRDRLPAFSPPSTPSSRSQIRSATK
jgi:hypothetical protein